MKTAVSIPDDTFERADRFARHTSRSRSKLFADALEEYLDRHSSEAITDAMNEALATIDQTPDPFVEAAARESFRRSDW